MSKARWISYNPSLQLPTSAAPGWAIHPRGKTPQGLRPSSYQGTVIKVTQQILTETGESLSTWKLNTWNGSSVQMGGHPTVVSKDSPAAARTAPRALGTELLLTRPGLTISHRNPPLSRQRSRCPREDAAARQDPRCAPQPCHPTATHLLLSRLRVPRRHQYLTGAGKGHAPKEEVAQWWR